MTPLFFFLTEQQNCLKLDLHLLCSPCGHKNTKDDVRACKQMGVPMKVKGNPDLSDACHQELTNVDILGCATVNTTVLAHIGTSDLTSVKYEDVLQIKADTLTCTEGSCLSVLCLQTIHQETIGKE